MAGRPKKQRRQQKKDATPTHGNLVPFHNAEVPGAATREAMEKHARQGGSDKIPYSHVLRDEICNRMMLGETLIDICKDDHIPDRITLLNWRLNFDDFAAKYDKAYQALIEFWAEEALAIADNSGGDWVLREDDDGKVVRVANHDHIKRMALRVDIRKWLLTKLLPKRFGDRIVQQQQALGADGEPITPLTAKDATEAVRNYLDFLNRGAVGQKAEQKDVAEQESAAV